MSDSESVVKSKPDLTKLFSGILDKYVKVTVNYFMKTSPGATCLRLGIPEKFRPFVTKSLLLYLKTNNVIVLYSESYQDFILSS